MRETTIRKKGALGSIPRGGSIQSGDSIKEIPVSTPQQGVEIAKVVPCAPHLCPKGTGCLQCDDLHQTHGKNGISPLPAVDEPIPYAPSEKCEKHNEYKPCYRCEVERSAPRVCLGIPIAQGPDEACTCFLGQDTQGDRCTPCAEWMRLCGQCDGCNGHLPGWNVTGELCGDCRDLALARTKRTPEMQYPLWKRVDDLIREGLEHTWNAMSEDSTFDPRTVAACKRLRDMERGL